MAAGLNFENGAANTVILISLPEETTTASHQSSIPEASATNGVSSPPVRVDLRKQRVEKDLPGVPQTNGGGVRPIKFRQQQSTEGENGILSDKMGVPFETTEPGVATTNGKKLAEEEEAVSNKPPATTTTNGHTTPTEELNDFSRQITINTSLKCAEDDDPAPLISPIDSSPPDATAGIPNPPPLPALEYPSTSSSSGTSGDRLLRLQTSPVAATPKYVGLVNQAMTCYLNSLLQALYMTPEFRNALYNWEFDGQDESKSIPYQLQRLFLNLQTSSKSAVETTDLTRSFGWDSSEAWQQHDIQELCRVMFDALEHKFKNTKEADLINRLYEGKMIDYLKCLSCGTEKQREDTFLDIPLPVKPFGSTVAFESVEEALRAFIQPEILNGNNQYSCEICQKKCDAHKGLKFSKFPYILTLHLKRFDFDYQTFHRIKLNDKVTFPQTLNLNGFVNTSTDLPATTTGMQNGAATTNGESCENGGISENGHTPMEVDSGGSSSGSEDEKAHVAGGDGEGPATTFGSHSGPYMYELFAIMIHSGSASGGHYYVYIKDLESANWFCFNDQCVSAITHEDIQKSFGGGAGRYQYSGAYTTSTNAYMMMYRQMDPARNKLPTAVEELPEHIRQLQRKLKDRQEVDNRRRNIDSSVIMTRVYHYDHERCTLSDVKIHISGDYYLDELLQRSYDRMNMATRRSLNLCRLVPFDHRTETTLASVEDHDHTLLQDVLDKYSDCDFLLEERDRDEKFRTYASAMVNARVYVVDLRAGDVDGPHRIPIQLDGTVADLKQEVRNALKNKCAGELRVALYKTKFAVILDNDADVLKHEIDAEELRPVKLFVASFPAAAKSRAELFDKRLKRTVERFDRVISLFFKVPEITPEIRKLHSIPEYQPPPPEAKVEEVAKVAAGAAKEEPMATEQDPIGRLPEVKVEDHHTPMEISSPEPPPAPLPKTLSPAPESTASSRSELTPSPSPEPQERQGKVSATPSPEPPAVRRKESATAGDGVTAKPKKKSLAVVENGAEAKGGSDEASEAKEKSPVRREVVETKEVTVNGVTKKVRVIKKFVKKDPAKKAAEAAAAAAADQPKPTTVESTATAVSPEKTPTKVLKKVKVAAKSPAKDVVEVKKSPSEVITVTFPAPTPKPVIADSVTADPVRVVVPKQAGEAKPVVVEDKIGEMKVEVPVEAKQEESVVAVDEFAYLDNEEACENGGVSTQYFKAIPKKKSISEQNGSIADDEMRLIQVHVEKNMTISTLKTYLEPVIMVSKDYFKVDKSRTESMRLSETLSSMA